MRDNNRIILAENEKDILIPLKTIFELNGYEVIITDKVKDLLPLVQSTNAKWMILDVELTDGTSITEITNLKNKNEDLIIFVLTGYYERYKELEILNSGADIMLRRPYTPEAILFQLQKIRNHIEGNKEKTSMIKKIARSIISFVKQAVGI
jgi:DNA-binding response OmpR family regulator